MNCIGCKETIKKGEQVYQLRLGEFQIDTFGGLAFEEADSVPIHGFVHFKCLDTIKTK